VYYEAKARKARKADRELGVVEYVRNGPPGSVLTLLRSMLPTIGVVVGAQGKLSRSAKQLVSDCAEKGSPRKKKGAPRMLPWVGQGSRFTSPA